MKYLLTLAILIATLDPGICRQDNVNYIILKGACFDYNKGPNIHADVYSIIDGKKQHLGTSNQAGMYTVKVPLSSNFLVFESAGFHPIKLPVRFIGQTTSEVEFLFNLPTSLLDSTVVPIEDALYMGTAKSVLKNYTVRLAKKECIVDIPGEMIDRGHKGAFMGVTQKTPTIDLSVTLSSKELIMKQKITVGKGLNFLLINAIQPELMSSDKKVSMEFPLTKNVYFNQTEYKLSKSSMMILDSIIGMIKPIQNYKISITGYTDHVGEKDKNLTLSEYRTRIVAKYLKDAGIQDSRINKQWFGSENLVSESEPEKNRRVGDYHINCVNFSIRVGQSLQPDPIFKNS